MDRQTKEQIASIILGGDGAHDAHYPKYRSSWLLNMLFADAGFPERVHDGEWRRGWVREQLISMDDGEVGRVVTRLALRREYDTDEQWQGAMRLLNEALGREGQRIASDGLHVTISRTNDERVDHTSLILRHDFNNAKDPEPADASGLSNRDIMVIYGRNAAARVAMFDSSHR